MQDFPLWVMTSGFNPVGYGSRLDNYKKFRQSLTVSLVPIEFSGLTRILSFKVVKKGLVKIFRVNSENNA